MSDLAEMRSQLVDIHRTLGRVEANQLSQQASIAALALGSERRDERLHKVEQRQFWFLGLGSGFSAGLGAILARFIPGHL